ncbi:lipase member I-like [Ptychodera flava]|uniref:lipase member I-like n=1 Tax=Ptychodera flava TaxID=63121 RepID=UPI003969CBF7
MGLSRFGLQATVSVVVICLCAISLTVSQECRDYGEDGRHCIDSFDELPQDNIEVNFKLYTRKHRNGVDMEFSSALHADFQFGKPIKFITHGFLSKGSEDWVKQIADELLKVGDFNVIVVDWEKAADPDTDLKWVEYDEASSNTRIVASRIKRLLGFILRQSGSSALNDVHLIGHSLGAQISGMVGKLIQRDIHCNGAPCKAARITALDPARPNFLIDAGERRRAPGPHCVSRDDAIFVDVIHSDAKEQDDHTGGTFPQLGIYQALGHADFYPNGGNKQPGCILFPCDHGRATSLFAASINSHCSFISETCSGSLALQNKRCSGCTSTPCQRMGYHAIKPSTPTLYYLETTGDEPFCDFTVVDEATRTLVSSSPRPGKAVGVVSHMIATAGLARLLNARTGARMPRRATSAEVTSETRFTKQVNFCSSVTQTALAAVWSLPNFYRWLR